MLNALAIEPYYGGSHKAFLDGVVAHSRHHWTLATLPPRHWKWRMRSSPLVILKAVATAIAQAGGQPDIILCSDMLDVASWYGLAARDPRFCDWIGQVPVITYFHENQWAYPTSPAARPDHHYGYTNLLTAIASDECWFNSEFNRRSFFDRSADFVRRMPDGHSDHDLQSVEAASRVIAPGFVPPPLSPRTRAADSPIRIGWVGRFEHDKRPDRFLALLEQLAAQPLKFQLILLGQRGRGGEGLDQIQARFPTCILHDGYAVSRAEYERHLMQMDVVVSTADHEFFGIAICEAIWSGAIPVTPNRLSYVEYVPDELRYESIDQAAQIITHLSSQRSRGNGSLDHWMESCRKRIANYQISNVTRQIDQALTRVVG
ncbi:DUF3524 domain-containing protein [Stieleria sp. TO1_6]|uniref:tRNA-queuosine alpha-mannosyltransferase domain-containing protein n=1 Tax=Stieleria tagensis TaxID=2956795 RepID=UPI00209A77AE|nr:DUF3524 domain-containing protein [Stieleria tagensis]MCO8122737.1 DUF3524 domain-containing protein [Stieleria tagensis]